MPAPNYSVVFWAPPSGTTTVIAVGNVLIPSAGDASAWVVATSANRSTRRAEAIAVSASGGSGFGPVEMVMAGTIDAATSGLAAGSASWVRTSTAGAIERCTPSGSDDIIGYAEADGRVHLAFGQFTAAIINGGGGGTPFTAAGDLTGDENAQTVARVNGTTVTTAGGALAVGAVLRTTAVGTADWGALNLADSDARTGTLPYGNGGTGLSALGTANQVLATNAGATAMEWQTAAVAGSPGGSDTHVQVNDAGAFYGESDLTYNKTTNTFTVGAGLIVSTTKIATKVPLAGDSAASMPLRLKVCSLDATGNGTFVLTAAQYECPIIYVSGNDSGTTIKLPPVDGAMFNISQSGYPFLVRADDAGAGAGVWLGTTVRYDRRWVFGSTEYGSIDYDYGERVG